MTKDFWDAVNEVIKKADVIIEVLDARFINDTINLELEDKAKKEGKKIIRAFNKADLASRETKNKYEGIYVSSTNETGLGKLRREIFSGIDKNKEKTIIGVVGYPNTGKSSLINALTKKEAARTSPQSGFTKGSQLIKMKDKIYMLDTPGVIPYLEKDRVKHALTSTVDFSKIKDPESAALELIEKFTEQIKQYYKVEGNNSDEILEAIAVRVNKLKKGGIPDLVNTARTILMDWQRGKIKLL